MGREGEGGGEREREGEGGRGRVGERGIILFSQYHYDIHVAQKSFLLKFVEVE